MSQLPKHSRITGAQRAQVGASLARQYERGKSIREIADAVGRSYGFVHRILREQPDLVLRGRGGDPRKRRGRSSSR